MKPYFALLAYVILLLGCGARSQLDVNPLGPVAIAAGLRLVAPLSTSTVTTRTPTLRWILGAGKDGAEIDLCGDRACSKNVVTFTATGTSAVPSSALDPGVHFWRARSTSGGKVGTESSPVWEFWVPARSTPVDTSWGTTLDVNGDGLPDLVVGAPDADTNVGRAYLYVGTPAGFADAPTTTLTGMSAPPAPGVGQGFFGTTVASGGDLNGDGFPELVVGAMSDGKGNPLVYVFAGGPSGISTTPIVLTDHIQGGFSASVAAAGDVNGDGYGDLVVGELTDFDSTANAYVYFGSAAGIDMSSATVMLPGPTTSHGIDGPIVASAGDVNGDGFDDVFVGADFFINTPGGTSMLYLGGKSGPSPTPSVTLTGPGGANLSYGGTPPCAVDLDRDGLADLVVRGGSSEQDLFVYRGGASGLPPAPTTVLKAPTPDSGWGLSLAAGDVDGDGFQDLFVGSNGVSMGVGAVVVFRGSSQGVESSPTMTIEGPDGPEGFFGTSVAVADVNGDGLADLIAGAFRLNLDVGRAYLFMGGTSGFAAPTTIFHAPDGEAPGRFGFSVSD